MGQKKHIPFIVSAILLCIAVYAVYPYYQYYVDPDATGYLTVIRRYVQGDYERAINGYWSPWSCWLVAVMEKYMHIGLMHCAVRVNTIGAIGFLYLTHSFLTYFKVRDALLWMVDIMVAVFLCFAVYGQLFDDLWECFFLLSSLRVMLREDFALKPLLWVAIGLMGALAYFAKAYAFPFFILNTSVCTFFITEAWRKENRLRWLKICGVSVAVMVAGSLPWIYALYERYGEWMTATAGKLNLSWYVVGHPYRKPGITHLIPPPFGDSPSYWEDPYLANGLTPNGFSSLPMLKLQLLRIPYNLLKMIDCMNQLSALFVAVMLVIIGVVFSKKVRSYFPEKLYLLGISFLLFPLAFMLMNFEARYIWYMLPINIVFGTLLLQKLLDYMQGNRPVRILAVLIFLLSYLYWPVWEMKKMFNVGRDDFQLAMRMNKEDVKGSFTAIANPGAQIQGLERVAYFSGNPFYTIPYPKEIGHAELLGEMRRYKVKYYLYFYNPAEGNYYQFTDEHGNKMPEVLRDEAYGIKVFRLLP